MPKDEIEALKQKFVEQLSPVGIYLFGSFAEGRNTEDSDFDFYIIVDDSVKDIPAETTKAYRSIRRTKQRPVDILVGTRSRFEARKNIPSVENEVFQKGVLLYGYCGKELAGLRKAGSGCCKASEYCFLPETAGDRVLSLTAGCGKGN